VATSTILDQNGEVLAEGDVLLVDIPPEVLGGVDLDALGWRVYPDETEPGERETRVFGWAGGGNDR
jgi:hypothetical protein